MRLAYAYKTEKRKEDAADAAKWRAVEPLLREWYAARLDECETMLQAEPVAKDEINRVKLRLFRAERALKDVVEKRLENVNQGLTKEPR